MLMAMMIHITKIDVGYNQNGVVFYNMSSGAKLNVDARYEFSFRAKLAHDAQYPALARPIAAFVNTVANGQGNLGVPLTIDTAWRDSGLLLESAHGEGSLKIGLCLDNGGASACKAATVTVGNPATSLAAEDRALKPALKRPGFDARGRRLEESPLRRALSVFGFFREREVPRR